MSALDAIKMKNGKQELAVVKTRARRTAQKLGVTRRELREAEAKVAMLRNAFDKYHARVIGVELECDVVAHMLRTMGPLSKRLSARVGEDLADKLARVGRQAQYAFDRS